MVRHLLAVQAQEPRTPGLALRARIPSLSRAAVEAALADGTLVVTWLMRTTLHLVHRDDLPWLHALSAPRQAAANERRLRQEGVSEADAARAVDVLAEVLGGGASLPRAELAARLAAEGVPVAGQATPHLLLRAAREGVLVGTLTAGELRFMGGGDLAAEAAAVDRDAALAELARRYLAAHAPADERDLAAWSGLPLRDVRKGLAAAEEPPSGHAAEGLPPGGGAKGFPPAPAASDGPEGSAPAPAAEGPGLAPRLLPAFDEYLLGWRDRSFAVAEAHARRVQPGGGIIRATVAADGALVATWSARRRAGTLRIDVDAFAEPPDVAAEAADVARFEGLALA